MELSVTVKKNCEAFGNIWLMLDPSILGSFHFKGKIHLWTELPSFIAALKIACTQLWVAHGFSQNPWSRDDVHIACY